MSESLPTKLLQIEYEQHGSPTGTPVLLLHGWPDSARTWDSVVPKLVSAGCRVYVPSLRGFGATRFHSPETERSGQMTALALDAKEFLDGLGISQAVVVGHDWGARLAYTLAALWPERVRKLVTLSGGYDVKVQRGHELPLPQAHAYWYQWYFHTDRGREALERNARNFCKYLWHTWAPKYEFTDKVFEQTALFWDNPDWVEVTLHAYRFRWGGAQPTQAYHELEERWSAKPNITVPTLLLHGVDDGATLVSSSLGNEHLFTGKYRRETLPGIGHFPQREDPSLVAKHIISWL